MTVAETTPRGPGRARTGRITNPAATPIAALRDVPHLATWVGLLVAAVGGAVLALGWHRVASLTDVSHQLPYLISAGCVGLGLVAAGLTVMSIAAKKADARQRTRQLTEMRLLLAELRGALKEKNL